MSVTDTIKNNPYKIILGSSGSIIAIVTAMFTLDARYAHAADVEKETKSIGAERPASRSPASDSVVTTPDPSSNRMLSTSIVHESPEISPESRLFTELTVT